MNAVQETDFAAVNVPEKLKNTCPSNPDTLLGKNSPSNVEGNVPENVAEIAVELLNAVFAWRTVIVVPKIRLLKLLNLNLYLPFTND